jgi:hypothetical protein
MSVQDASSERISLTMRTSWMCEFRTAAGALARIEIAGHRTTFGRLCTMLAQIEGIEFADHRIPARYTGPTRFRFKGKDYELSLVHQDYRIVAADLTASSNADEFLIRVKEQLARRTRLNALTS